MYPEVILKVRSREGASVREEGAGGPCPPWGSPFRCPIVGWAGGGVPRGELSTSWRARESLGDGEWCYLSTITEVFRYFNN